MDTWLERKLENRSVAEVSIHYAIIVTGTLILLIILLWGSMEAMGLKGNIANIIAIMGWIVWLGFLVWLWRALVKAGRVKLRRREGGEIFNMIKYGFLIMTAVVLILHGGWREGFGIYLMVLLAFDAFILFSGLFFFPMAWSIGCKIQRKTYLDFAIMLSAIVFQIWATS